MPTQKERLQEAAQQAASTFRKVLPYILVGVGVGAVIHNWIPQDWILGLLGNGNPLGVLVAVAVGIPMYADIFGTIPVAEALLARGADLGTVLAFMMAVTTLSLPSLILLQQGDQAQTSGDLYRRMRIGNFAGGIWVQCRAGMDWTPVK